MGAGKVFVAGRYSFRTVLTLYISSKIEQLKGEKERPGGEGRRKRGTRKVFLQSLGNLGLMLPFCSRRKEPGGGDKVKNNEERTKKSLGRKKTQKENRRGRAPF